MINYSNWTPKSVRVADTILDPENPRIPPAPSTPAQLELIRLFCIHYDVYSLAKSMTEDGYFPDERIVVTEQDGSYIVLEGNRRITALKVLMNPDLAPDEMKSKFQRLGEVVERKVIAQCDALVAPSRNAATKLILEKHTQQSVLSWSPLMKAEFYRKMTEQGISSVEISKQYNITPSSVQGFLRTSRIYRIALGADLPSHVRELVSDPQKFPITNLERIYDNWEARKILTLSDDLETVSCSPSAFRKALNRMVSDIATGEKDSRSLDNAGNIREYAKQIAEDAQIKEIDDKIKIETIFPQHQVYPYPLPQKPHLKATRSTRQSKGLFGLNDIPFRLTGASSLRRLYDELRGLPVKSYPNTSAILLRVFTDKAVRHFLKRKGQKSISVGRQTKKLVDATFGEILDFLCEKSNPLLGDENVKKAVRSFKSSPSFRSLSTLNSIIHSEELSFSEPQARDLFPNLEGLLKLLLSQ